MRWRAQGRNDGREAGRERTERREAAVQDRRGVRLSLTGLIK